ncbi:unnamed protein product, partial [Ectocarpus fasciculatus]
HSRCLCPQPYPTEREEEGYHEASSKAEGRELPGHGARPGPLSWDHGHGLQGAYAGAAEISPRDPRRRRRGGHGKDRFGKDGSVPHPGAGEARQPQPQDGSSLYHPVANSRARRPGV